jgi:hypothetical protein
VNFYTVDTGYTIDSFMCRTFRPYRDCFVNQRVTRRKTNDCRTDDGHANRGVYEYDDYGRTIKQYLYLGNGRESGMGARATGIIRSRWPRFLCENTRLNVTFSPTMARTVVYVMRAPRSVIVSWKPFVLGPLERDPFDRVHRRVFYCHYHGLIVPV